MKYKSEFFFGVIKAILRAVKLLCMHRWECHMTIYVYCAILCAEKKSLISIQMFQTKKIQQMIVEKINKEKIGAFNYLLVDHLYRF